MEIQIKKLSTQKIAKMFKPLNVNSMYQNSNPVVCAHNIWKIVNDQLTDILGLEIAQQWFQPLIPLIISDNCLIILAPNEFSTSWLNEHYKELIDLLISFQDKKISSFIIDKKIMSSKSTTSKVDSYKKHSHS